MAGSERSGPFAASASLFDGRPVGGHAARRRRPRRRRRWSTALARLCGATPVTFSPERARPGGGPHLPPAAPARRAGRRPAHRRARASTSRCPGRASATSPGSPPATRSCGSRSSPPTPTALTALLRDVRDDVDTLLGALDRRRPGPARRDPRPRASPARPSIPGKHGGPSRAETTVFVAVPDHPGELARLLADAGEIGVNIEDLRIDHDPGREYGLVELTVGHRPRRPPAGLARGPGLDHPPVVLHRSGSPIGEAGTAGGRGRGDGRAVGIGEVEHVARRGRPARAALPRHRGDVPRDDLVDARARRRRRGRRGGGRAGRRAGAGLRHRPAGARRSPSTAPTWPAPIREQAVTSAVSAVSAVPEVRAAAAARAARHHRRRRHRRRGPRHRHRRWLRTPP